MNAVELVSQALLGTDKESILVNGKEYYIAPPTIKRIVGAGQHLARFGDENIESPEEYIREMVQMISWSKALSWFIKGDESLADELSEGTLAEVLAGVETAIRLIDLQNFIRLSVLAKNVKMLIAKQR